MADAVALSDRQALAAGNRDSVDLCQSLNEVGPADGSAATRVAVT
jgi:hypothetical protein